MIRSVKLVIIASAVIALLGVAYTRVNANRPRQVVVNANWVEHYKNIEEAAQNAEIILIAKVAAPNAYKLHEMIFTNYPIQIEKVLRANGQVPEDIEVSLSGGELNGVNYRFEEQKMLRESDRYLFLLHKRWPKNAESNEYTIVGGYQGVIRLQGDSRNNTYRGQQFNPDNDLEQELIDQDVLQKLANCISPSGK